MSNQIQNSKIAIVYLLWNDEPKKYLARALDAISAQTYARENLSLIVVYNSHKPNEESQLSFVEGEMSKHQDALPKTTILPQKENLGFAPGNNLGIQHALESGCDYVFLHNADGYLAPTGIEEMIKAFGDDKQIGQVQALMRLSPETDLVNSAGNNFQYLGIGYCAHFRDRVDELNLPAVSDIGYASGGATMMRTDLLKQHGQWNENFYLYHEDTEYSLRLKINSFRIVLASHAEFFHEYNFDKSVKKFYWLERNRHALKYLFYRWPTIILTWPLEIGYNLGLMVLALVNGWLPELLRVYWYWLNPGNWKKWQSVRQQNLKNRQLSDRQFLAQASVTVGTAELVTSPSLKFLANSIFKLYYYFLKLIIWW